MAFSALMLASSPSPPDLGLGVVHLPREGPLQRGIHYSGTAVFLSASSLTRPAASS